MTGRITSSPRLLARMTGVFFLLTILGGIFAQGFVSERLINFGDAAATANNILANKGLFHLGFAVYLIEMACQVAMTALFYVLLRPVSRSVSLLSAFWGLTGCVIKTFARVFYIVPLFVLGGSASLSSFSTEQLQSLAIVLLRINDVGAGIALAFFGFSTVLKGWLTFRSTFLPKWLGVLSIVSGLGWVAFLYPPLGYRAFPIIALLGLIGSAASIFWLLVFGVDEEKWREKAAAAALTRP
jgi:hypothetical protein